MRKSDTFIGRIQYSLEQHGYKLEIIWLPDDQLYEAYVIDGEGGQRYQGQGYGRVQAIAGALMAALLAKTRPR